MQVAGALEPQPEPGALLIIQPFGLGRERKSGPTPGASRAWAGARAELRRPSSPRHVTPPLPTPRAAEGPGWRAGGQEKAENTEAGPFPSRSK